MKENEQRENEEPKSENQETINLETFLEKEIQKRVGENEVSDLNYLKPRILKRVLEVIDEEIKSLKVAVPIERELKEEVVRFNLSVIIQHLIMMISVLILIFTGLPLKFHETGLSASIISFLGGIKNSMLLHRIGATGLIFVGVYHLLSISFSKDGRGDFLRLIPNFKDLKDFFIMVKYFLGLSKEKARFGRFSYVEKFDYWAVYWGMVIMIGSGSLLWFHNLAMRIFPKYIMDIAKEAHSDEGLLATLAIIIWHFYNTHLNPSKFPLNTSIFTGKITKEEIIDEHPLEYEEMMKENLKNKDEISQN